MAKVMIGHHPELTAESTMKVFQGQFADKYELYMTRIPRTDFIVKQSAWRGVGVSLRRKRGRTYFEFMGTTPSTALLILRGLLGVGWFILCLRAFGEAGGGGGMQGAGAFIGFFVLLFLGFWVLRLPFSRPSRKMENEVKVFVESAEEFKQPCPKSSETSAGGASR